MTDKYGRLFGVLILSPYLVYCGYIYNNNILLIFGVLLFIYELFWICNSGPQVIYLK